jgi:membrane protein implicated in regulation of membrane protease activity
MFQAAKQSDETIFQQVQPYMVAILPRISFNYLILTSSLVVLWFIGLQLLAQILPFSTANVIMFALSLIIFVRGWRFLENRNHATALFILYTRYSRQRREFRSIIATEIDEETLQTNLQWLKDSAQSFIDAATENGVEPIMKDD